VGAAAADLDRAEPRELEVLRIEDFEVFRGEGHYRAHVDRPCRDPEEGELALACIDPSRLAGPEGVGDVGGESVSAHADEEGGSLTREIVDRGPEGLYVAGAGWSRKDPGSGQVVPAEGARAGDEGVPGQAPGQGFAQGAEVLGVSGPGGEDQRYEHRRSLTA
jgi:hypothetical protein